MNLIVVNKIAEISWRSARASNCFPKLRSVASWINRFDVSRKSVITKDVRLDRVVGDGSGDAAELKS